MNSSNALYEDFSGSDFFDDILNTSEGDSLLSQEKQNDEPLDILQQSLQAAEIINSNHEPGELPLDDFGFTLEDCYNSNNNSTSLSYDYQNTQSSSGGQYMLQQSQASSSEDNTFDTLQFLNVSTTSTVQKPTELQQIGIGTGIGGGTVTSLVHDNTRMVSPKPVHATQHFASIQNTAASPVARQHNTTNIPQNIQQNFTIQQQHPNIKLQGVVQSQSIQDPNTTSNSATLLKRQGNTVELINGGHLYQSSQYVVSGGQSVTPYNNTSYSVCTSNAVQSNSVGACGTSFTRPPTQALSAPIVISLNTSHQNIRANTALKPNYTVISQTPAINNLAAAQSQVNFQQQNLSSAVISPVQKGNTAIGNHSEEKVNKLATMIHNRAAQHANSGNAPIFRWKNQNINISSYTTARALAIKMLENSPLQHTAVASKNNTQLVNIASAVSNTSALQTKVIVTTPSIARIPPPVKAHYLIASVPQTIGVKRSNTTQPTLTRLVAQQSLPQRIVTSVKPVSSIQTTVSKSSSPVSINRFQIASVNIPITTSQIVNSNATSSPISKTNYQLLQNTNLVKTNTSQSAASLQLLQNKVISNAAPNSSAPSVLVQQLNTSLKLNITPQQANNLNREQLQKLLIQHQAAVRARKSTAQANSSLMSPTVTTPIANTTSALKAKVIQSVQKNEVNEKTVSTKTLEHVVTIRVDPNLTLQQAEEVQQIILQNASFSKQIPIATLSREQKQLLTAYRAQLQGMEAPVQQYYRRNPHLFVQKVYQHLQSGKPFLLHIKAENIKNMIAQGISSKTNIKEQHPTISLSTDAQKSKIQTIKINRPLTPTPQTRMSLKRPAPEPSALITPPIKISPLKRPSMLMEQLQNHRAMTVSPDVTAGFKTVRDACRRLLPYHVYNMRQINVKYFEESEPLFDDISDRLTTRKNSMIAKYHTLCLREATRETCSADVVMLERSFLQQERAQLAEMKQKLKDDPNSIKDFLSSDSQNVNQELVSYLHEQELKNGVFTPARGVLSAELVGRKISHQSLESVEYSSPNSFTSNKTSSIPNMQVYEPVECEVLSLDNDNDVLLQEAVESILT